MASMWLGNAHQTLGHSALTTRLRSRLSYSPLLMQTTSLFALISVLSEGAVTEGCFPSPTCMGKSLSANELNLQMFAIRKFADIKAVSQQMMNLRWLMWLVMTWQLFLFNYYFAKGHSYGLDNYWLQHLWPVKGTMPLSRQVTGVLCYHQAPQIGVTVTTLLTTDNGVWTD